MAKLSAAFDDTRSGSRIWLLRPTPLRLLRLLLQILQAIQKEIQLQILRAHRRAVLTGLTVCVETAAATAVQHQCSSVHPCARPQRLSHQRHQGSHRRRGLPSHQTRHCFLMTKAV
jgi:hypothetical protein